MRRFTEKDIAFLKANHRHISNKKLAAALGRTVVSIQSKLCELGLHKPKKWTADMLHFLKVNGSSLSNKQISEVLGVSVQSVKCAFANHKIKTTRTGHFPKRNRPWNYGLKGINFGGKETQFKKGHQPHNTKQDGVITIRTDKTGRKYQWVRISLGKWRELQRVVYEKHHGKIPRGFNVVFKDGNSLNCNPDNLVAIDNLELMELNTIARFPGEVRQAIHLVAKVKRKIKKYEKQD